MVLISNIKDFLDKYKYLILIVTILFIAFSRIQMVPREYANIGDIQIREDIGTDFIADNYTAKVALNDPFDIYTKNSLNQTEQEAQTWTKEESSPYPPLAIYHITTIYKIGDILGIGFYGVVISLELILIIMVFLYFIKTNWYLIPIVYLNFYLAHRFWWVGDATYLLVLIYIMMALFTVKKYKTISISLMAIATIIKFSPIYYIKNIFTMKKHQWILYISILVIGLILPFIIYKNYSYIYTFNSEKSEGFLLPFIVAGSFSIALCYIEYRMKFNDEDIIGWASIPFAIFTVLSTYAVRHLLLLLIIPDKRGYRNIALLILIHLRLIMDKFDFDNRIIAWSSIICFLIIFMHMFIEIGLEKIISDIKNPILLIKKMVLFKQ